MTSEVEPFTRAYRVVMAIGRPIMRWSRMRVTGAELIPLRGPTLLIANHDSYWDPIAIGAAAYHRRQPRALAKSTLWKNKAVAAFMNEMGHIPVDRKASNDGAIAVAVAELRAGGCIGVFPEATRSLGRQMRAHSGAGRLAAAVPEATIVCARVTGTVDVVRVPKRPSVTVDFFLPAGGQLRPGETPGELTDRLVAELRTGAPPVVPGRRRTAEKHARTLELR